MDIKNSNPNSPNNENPETRDKDNFSPNTKQQSKTLKDVKNSLESSREEKTESEEKQRQEEQHQKKKEFQGPQTDSAKPKQEPSSEKERNPTSLKDPYIQTMKEDIKNTKEGKETKTGPPPSELPTGEEPLKDQAQKEKFKPEEETPLSPKDRLKKETSKETFGFSADKKEQEPKEKEPKENKTSEPPKPTSEKSKKAAEESNEQKREKEKTEKKQPIQKKGLKLTLIFVLVFLLIAGAGGFFYWWNYLKITPTHYTCQNNKCVSIEGEGESTCSRNEDCQPEEKELEKPSPVFQTDRTEIAEIKQSNLDQLPSKIKDFTQSGQTDGSFTRVLIEVSNSQKYYLDFNSLVSNLGIKIPEKIMWAVSTPEIESGNYTLFYYIQGEKTRMGLAIALDREIDIEEGLKEWEKTMKKDLNPLFATSTLPEAATEEFRDHTRKDIEIRYLNFPDPELTLDYAKTDNKLIIATSKESMFEIVDRLTGGND